MCQYEVDKIVTEETNAKCFLKFRGAFNSVLDLDTHA